MKTTPKKISPTLYTLLTHLNDLEFHDGPTLAAHLGISRTAVWKWIKKLEQYGIALHIDKVRGYALAHPLQLLEAARIKKILKTPKVKLHVFESMESTNDYAKAYFEGRQIQVCLTETQSHGRGRFHRHWCSPFGQNIYLSLSYPFSQDMSQLGGLSLVTSLSIVRTLNHLYTLSTPALIKWPNDVIADHHKLAGSLIEIKAESHGSCQVVIGIGINVNAIKLAVDNQPWTSLLKLTGQHHDRNVLVSHLIDTLISDLHRFSEKGFQSFLKEWQQYDLLKGKKITLKQGDHLIHGTACGLDEQGLLLLRTADKEMKAFSSGEVAVVKKN